LESSTDEVKEDIKFLRALMADPARFNAWANDLLDRAHKVDAERKASTLS
jgi:hypothetical protein